MNRRWVHALLLTAGLSVLAGHAQAHAVRATEQSTAAQGTAAQSTARVLRFAYSTGEEAAYCAVEVYAPNDAKVEYQNGRTDASGLFAFVPNKPGAWNIIMTDGMGHKLEHIVDVVQGGNEPAPASITETGGTPDSLSILNTWGRAVLGVSLLLNIFAGLALFRRRT